MSESVEMPVEKSSLGSVGAHFKSLCVLRGWGGGGGGRSQTPRFGRMAEWLGGGREWFLWGN